MGEVFDDAFQRRFEDLDDADEVARSLDADVDTCKGRAAIPRQAVDAGTAAEAERLGALRKHLDLAPGTLRATLEIALGIGVGQPRLEGPDARGRMALVRPLPKAWEPLIDEHLRLPAAKQADKGGLPGLIFDPQLFMTTAGERPVFRPAKDTVLLHLGHPLFREALATFARLRFPGEKDLVAPSRWTVRHGEVPTGADALVLLTVEELAVNELREPFHHWVRTLRFPVKGDTLGPRAAYVAPADEPPTTPAHAREEPRRRAVALWDDLAPDLRDALAAYATEITGRVRRMLDASGKVALREEKKRYDHRLKEVRAAMADNTLEKLDAEIAKLKKKLAQLSFIRDRKRVETEKTLADKEDERRRREVHYGELLEVLTADQDRVITRMLPRRYTLHAEVRVFPVSVEILLPR